MTDGSAAARVFQEAELRHLLAREVQRSTRYQDFLSLCVIRVAYPLAPPPAMQAAVAAQIAEMLRATDIVGILGDDITVLLVHTPDTDATMIVDRIRDRLCAVFPAVASPAAGRMTLGIGLASFPTDATSDTGLLTHARIRLQSAQEEWGPSVGHPEPEV